MVEVNKIIVFRKAKTSWRQLSYSCEWDIFARLKHYLLYNFCKECVFINHWFPKLPASIFARILIMNLARSIFGEYSKYKNIFSLVYDTLYFDFYCHSPTKLNSTVFGK